MSQSNIEAAREALDEAEHLQRVVAGIHDVTPSVLALLTVAVTKLVELEEGRVLAQGGRVRGKPKEPQ